MAAPRYLTKSRFKIAIECPTKLFYTGKRQEYADTMAENGFLAMLAEGGHQVGALAKLRYPDGFEIHEKDHAAAEARTRDHLARDHVVLFEPAIRFGNLFIRIDVLIKNGNDFELIEVKAKSYNSAQPEFYNRNGSIKSDFLPYVQDAAFQTWVLQQAYPGAHISTALMMPDKSRAAPVDGVNQMFKISGKGEVDLRIPDGIDAKSLAEDLLAKVDISTDVSDLLKSEIDFPGGPALIGDAASTWADAYASDRRIKPVLGRHCKACEFKANVGGPLKSGFHECWKQANNWQDNDFSDGLVLDLSNCRRIPTLIDQGIYKLTQVNKEDLGDFDEDPGAGGLTSAQRQWFQVNGLPGYSIGRGYYFDDTLVRAEMAKWHFPYHFIDFETAAVSLPFYAGMRPYEQIAFQFSHHVMTGDGKVSHVGQYLCAVPGQFPNFDFARALMKELGGDEGTIFMWSHHENTILSKISYQLDAVLQPPADAEALKTFLSSVTRGGSRSMVDLCALAGKAYFHPDTKGSSSIKKVLPAILSTSPMLKATYSQPIYGAPDGVASLNYSSREGLAWIDIDGDGAVSDPYAKLKQAAREMLPEGIEDSPEGSASIIAEGGAAAMAYGRLQFEDLDDTARRCIESALLRYCELDTLAMVMVMQAWKDDCG